MYRPLSNGTGQEALAARIGYEDGAYRGPWKRTLGLAYDKAVTTALNRAIRRCAGRVSVQGPYAIGQDHEKLMLIGSVFSRRIKQPPR